MTERSFVRLLKKSGNEPRSDSSLEVLVRNETRRWKFQSSCVCTVLETSISDMSHVFIAIMLIPSDNVHEKVLIDVDGIYFIIKHFIVVIEL
jgi:hypothetical protein